MKRYEWNLEKDKILLKERKISFQEIVIEISRGNIVEVLKHPNERRYPSQRIYVILIREYIYLVPFVDDGEKIFLKTIIPSRKATKNYYSNIQNEKNKTK